MLEAGRGTSETIGILGVFKLQLNLHRREDYLRLRVAELLDSLQSKSLIPGENFHF